MDTNPSGVSPQHESGHEAAAEKLLARWNPPAKADTPKAEQPAAEKAEAKPETEAKVEEPAKAEAPEQEAKTETPAEADKAEVKEEATDDEKLVIELDGEKLTAKEIRELKKKDHTERMLQADYTRKTQTLAEQRKAVEAKAQEIEAVSQRRLDELAFTSQIVMQQALQIEKNTNWEELRQTNPAEFAARHAQVQQRKEALNRAHVAYLQIEQQRQAKQQEQSARKLAEEAELLPTKIPEWADEKVAAQEKSALAEYLQKDGFTKDDEALLGSHKVVSLARKAWLYDRQQAELAKAKEKAAKVVPKLIKPGAENAAPNKAQKALETLRIRGDRDSAVDVLMARSRG
jgi:hypothetical protein